MRFPVQTALLLALATALPLSTATAQDSGDSNANSTSVGGNLRVPPLESAGSSTVVDGDELDARDGSTVADLLRGEPGVLVQETNRGSGAPVLRGQIGPSVLILFDGLRFNNGVFRTGPNQYLNLFSPFSLAQIDVLQGPGSTLYGSDAVGGTVALSPPPLTYNRGFGGGAVLRFDSADTALVMAPSVTWSNRATSVQVGGAFEDHGELRTGGGDQLLASAYDKSAFQLRLGHFVADRTELQLSYHFVSIADASRVDVLPQSNFRVYDNTNHFVIARVLHDGDGAFDHVDVAIGLNAIGEDVTRNDCNRSSRNFVGANGPFEASVTTDIAGCIAGTEDAISRQRELLDDTLTVTAHTVVTSRPEVDGLAIVWGTDVQHTAVSSTRFDTTPPDRARQERAGNYADGSTYTQLGAFVSGSLERPLSDTFTLEPEAGLRLSHVRAHAPDVPDLGAVNFDDTGLAAHAGVVGRFDSGSDLSLAWQQGFRAPNLSEATVLGDTGNFFEIPNPDLSAERANGVDLGGHIVSEYLTVDAAVWVMAMSNYIARRPAEFEGASDFNGTPVRERYNADSALFFGGDLGIETARWNGVSLFGQTSLIQGDVTVDGVSEPARRVPPLLWAGGVRYELERPSLHAQVRVRGAGAQRRLNSGDLSDLRICASSVSDGVLASAAGETCAGTDAWTTLDLSIGAGFTEHVDVLLAFENLLDAAYRSHGSGTDAAGFGASIRLEARF